MKKTTRFLALFLCLVLAPGFLPPKTRAASRLTLARRDLQTHLVYGTNYIPTDIVISLDLDTMKATASFVTKEAVMNKESTYTKEEYAWIKDCENQSATVSYDIKAGGAGDDFQWLLTNASGAESFIWGVDRYSDSDYRDFAPYAHKKTVHCHFTSYGDRYEDMNLLFYYPEELFIGADHGHIYDNLVKVDRNRGSFGVNRSDETPAQPEKREYTMGRDNFGFDNEWSAFFDRPTRAEATGIYAAGTRWGSYGSLLDDSSIKAMISGRSFSQTADIISRLNRRWQGSCYGMSITSGLLFEEKLSPRQFAVGSDPYHFTEPANNEELARTLTYYQVIMNYDFLGYEKRHSTDLPGSRSTALSIARSLKEAPEHPVVVGFSFSEDDGAQRVWHAHAVLAFKVEDASGGYKYDVSVYDPNEPKEARHIYLTEDGDASFAPYNNPYFRNADKARDLYDVTLSYPELPPDVAMVTTDGGVEIETDGKTTTVQNGQITGSQDVTAEQLEGSDETVIYVPVKSGQSIRVRRIGGTSASVQTDNTFVLFTDGAEEATVNADGSVTAKTDGSEGTLAVAADKTSGDLFGTTVTTSAGEITITPTANGATVTTSGGTADITVSGEKNSVTFEDVDTSKGVEIKSSGSNTTLFSDGQEIAKGTATADGGKTEAAQPQQPAADKQQIGDNASQKAGGNSTQIVDNRKKSGDTTEQFRSRCRNKKYSPWAEEELALADALGIIPEALFDKLQGNITRKEFAQLVYNTVKAATGMSDADMAKYASKPNNVYASQYSDPAVAFAYGVGIVSGFEDGSFRPDNTITREQAAKMLVVMAELLGKLTSESGAKRFNDAPNNWAQTYINKISSVTSPYSGARVMGGDDKGNFSPTGTFTTEQAVATMLRMFESVVGEKSGYSGGVIETAQPRPQQTSGGVSVRADNDQTGFTPKDWSWSGEGSRNRYFISGKYVRSDGRAVFYIDCDRNAEGLYYQGFVMSRTSGKLACSLPLGGETDGIPYGTAFYDRYASGADDDMNGLHFFCHGDTYLTLDCRWNDELLSRYSNPTGVYYLVREKK